MRKALLLFAGLAVLVLSVRWVVLAFVSDATKIRWIVEDMEAAYDAGDPGGVVDPLAFDWRHDGVELDRRMLFGGLLGTARDRDATTGELRSRVTVAPEAVVVSVDGDHATLEAEAVFERLTRETWRETWRVVFEAELEKDGGDWRIVRSAHRDVRGTHLGR
jgi:hypothetical protein